MLVWFLSSLVFLPLYSSQYLKYGNINYKKEDVIIVNALNKVIDSMFHNANSVNIDGMLGIVVAEAQINMMFQKVDKRNILFGVISKLKRKTHNLNKLLNSTVIISAPTYENIYTLLNTTLWEQKITFKNMSLLRFPLYNWISVPYPTLINSITHNGSPNEEESGQCINELLEISTDTYENNNCVPSLKCMSIMSELQKSNGYPLTHKLLYIQVAKLMRCRIDENIVEKSIHFLCSRILQEFQTIENMKTKYISLQDLYFEQMVLCGLEGYTEFLTFKSRANLLSWQSKYGCYGIVPNIDNRWRSKRDISYMKHGCESHITGLAAAALAINLNFLISTISENDLLYTRDDYNRLIFFH